MKLNDIYRWHYNETKSAKLAEFWGNGFYHGVSNICVAKANEAGELYLEDTFWSYDNTRLNLNDVDLEYLGNFDDLQKFTGRIDYYNPSDIVNLNHPNNSSGNIYIRKGAKKCLETVRAHIKKQIEEKEYRAKSAAEDVVRYRKVLDELNENNLDQVWI